MEPQAICLLSGCDPTCCRGLRQISNHPGVEPDHEDAQQVVLAPGVMLHKVQFSSVLQCAQAGSSSALHDRPQEVDA